MDHQIPFQNLNYITKMLAGERIDTIPTREELIKEKFQSSR